MIDDDRPAGFGVTQEALRAEPSARRPVTPPCLCVRLLRLSRPSTDIIGRPPEEPRTFSQSAGCCV